MKSNNINKVFIFLAILMQVMLVLSIKVFKDLSIKEGRKIIVKTAPVDPRDLFRGDYIILNYDFSRIDLDKIRTSTNYFSRGDELYVKLALINGDWKPVEVDRDRINDVSENEIMIRGSVVNWPYGNMVDVNYGIESFFVPEGKGKYIEKKIAQNIVTVELSVDKRGNASVMKIFIEGKEVDFR